jgi:hypothetical protein
MGRSCGPQKLDQTYRLPELRERTPLLWATTRGYQNPCRTFAELSYALLCTVMQFATDVTAKKQRKFKNLGAGIPGYEPGARRAPRYCGAMVWRACGNDSRRLRERLDCAKGQYNCTE